MDALRGENGIFAAQSVRRHGTAGRGISRVLCRGYGGRLCGLASMTREVIYEQFQQPNHSNALWVARIQSGDTPVDVDVDWSRGPSCGRIHSI